VTCPCHCPADQIQRLYSHCTHGAGEHLAASARAQFNHTGVKSRAVKLVLRAVPQCTTNVLLMSCSKDTRHDPGVCGSPKSSGDLSDRFASSAGSMDPHGNHLTPPDSPASPGSPESPTATVNIARLSLENHRRPYDPEEATREAIRAAVTKRVANTELRGEPLRYSLSGRVGDSRTAVASSREGVHRRNAEHRCRSGQGSSAQLRHTTC